MWSQRATSVYAAPVILLSSPFSSWQVSLEDSTYTPYKIQAVIVQHFYLPSIVKSA
jgi:hypothetical protein